MSAISRPILMLRRTSHNLGAEVWISGRGCGKRLWGRGGGGGGGGGGAWHSRGMANEWRRKQDHYAKQAKRDGMRSRASFKLQQMQEKVKLLKPGSHLNPGI